MNKQAPGNNLQIEVQNLTFLHSVDSSDKTNPTSKCNADKWHFPMASVCANTGIITYKVELTLR